MEVRETTLIVHEMRNETSTTNISKSNLVVVNYFEAWNDRNEPLMLEISKRTIIMILTLNTNGTIFKPHLKTYRGKMEYILRRETAANNIVNQ